MSWKRDFMHLSNLSCGIIGHCFCNTAVNTCCRCGFVIPGNVPFSYLGEAGLADVSSAPSAQEEPEFTPEQLAALQVDYDEWLKARQEPAQALAALRAALREYGRHKKDCPQFLAPEDDGLPHPAIALGECTCGFEAVAGREETP